MLLKKQQVSILVLMDIELKPSGKFPDSAGNFVSILVLMDIELKRGEISGCYLQ